MPTRGLRTPERGAGAPRGRAGRVAFGLEAHAVTVLVCDKPSRRGLSWSLQAQLRTPPGPRPGSTRSATRSVLREPMLSTRMAEDTGGSTGSPGFVLAPEAPSRGPARANRSQAPAPRSGPSPVCEQRTCAVSTARPPAPRKQDCWFWCGCARGQTSGRRTTWKRRTQGSVFVFKSQAGKERGGTCKGPGGPRFQAGACALGGCRGQRA